jgi:hypothetical protein
MKTCSHCGEEKEESEFYKLPTTQTGLNSWCKKCMSEISTKHYYKKKATRIKKLDVVCAIIKEHNEDLKDDPERLHSDFLTSLVCDSEHRRNFIKKQVEKVRFDPDKKWEEIGGE